MIDWDCQAMSNKMQVQISQLLGLLALKMGDGKAEMLVWRWTHRTGTGRFKRVQENQILKHYILGLKTRWLLWYLPCLVTLVILRVYEVFCFFFWTAVVMCAKTHVSCAKRNGLQLFQHTQCKGCPLQRSLTGYPKRSLYCAWKMRYIPIHTLVHHQSSMLWSQILVGFEDKTTHFLLFLDSTSKWSWKRKM